VSLEPDPVEVRRAARERALELLYEAETKGVPLDDVLRSLPTEPDPLAALLARGVDEHRARIDEILAERIAPSWTVERLAATDRAVLRMGVFELLERRDVPVPVVLNEAVLLASRFGSDDSGRFVNGVLGKVAADHRGQLPGDDGSADPAA
jgi:N utilization substance protein B